MGWSARQPDSRTRYSRSAHQIPPGTGVKAQSTTSHRTRTFGRRLVAGACRVRDIAAALGFRLSGFCGAAATSWNTRSCPQIQPPGRRRSKAAPSDSSTGSSSRPGTRARGTGGHQPAGEPDLKAGLSGGPQKTNPRGPGARPHKTPPPPPPFRGRVEAPRATATPPPQTMCRPPVRPPHPPRTIGTRPAPSPLDQPPVDPSRNTETYASLTFQLDRPPLGRHPFTLPSGKALPGDRRDRRAPNEPPSPGNSRCARQRRGSPRTHT